MTDYLISFNKYYLLSFIMGDIVGIDSRKSFMSKASGQPVNVDLLHF